MQKLNPFAYEDVTYGAFLFSRPTKVRERGKAPVPVQFEVWMVPLDVDGQYMAQEKGDELVRSYLGYPDFNVPPQLPCPYEKTPTEKMLRDIGSILTSFDLARESHPENPAYNDLDLAKMTKTMPDVYEALVTEINSQARKTKAIEDARDEHPKE